MSRLIELPDRTYDALLRVSANGGATQAEWIASVLSHTENMPIDAPSSAQIKAANAKLREHTI